MSDILNSGSSEQQPVDNTGNQPQEVPQLSPEESVHTNPAWDGLLGKVPSGLHPMIIPELSKWDKNFQEVQTKYSPYKDYVDNGIQPDQINQALGLMQLALQNPRVLYDQMVQQFGDEWGLNNAPVQGQSEVDISKSPFDLEDDDSNSSSTDYADIENHPKFKELKQNLDTVAGFLANQVEEQEAAKYDQQLDQEITGLKQSKGDFDEQFVLALAHQGIPLAQAVDLYHQKINEAVSTQRNNGYRPSIMPTGGGLPSSQVDVTALSPKDTRSLVADLIKTINQ